MASSSMYLIGPTEKTLRKSLKKIFSLSRIRNTVSTLLHADKKTGNTLALAKRIIKLRFQIVL